MTPSTSQRVMEGCARRQAGHPTSTLPNSANTITSVSRSPPSPSSQQNHSSPPSNYQLTTRDTTAGTTTTTKLSLMLYDHGRDSSALALMESCAEARQRVLSPEHPDTLSSLAILSEWREKRQVIESLKVDSLNLVKDSMAAKVAEEWEDSRKGMEEAMD
ncbi:hypothetical protein N657DRAFT_650478 [Parathielavia appendiculata]|uniref:Kinesin light chain n=1 Tax=Parathielavia appendiculata TaxID=2587402 RepID=A0AAN6TR65_9PEZI|nr:hypothetical protein N657DRAFT_650478 [Parathielavia appendiculata]